MAAHTTDLTRVRLIMILAALIERLAGHRGRFTFILRCHVWQARLSTWWQYRVRRRALALIGRSACEWCHRTIPLNHAFCSATCHGDYVADLKHFGPPYPPAAPAFVLDSLTPPTDLDDLAWYQRWPHHQASQLAWATDTNGELDLLF